MKTKWNKVFSMLLVTAMLLTMMTVPTLASGTVEITSPAYGAVVEVGEATKVFVASDAEPTVTAAGTALTVTEASSGIWEAAWTPASSGMITLAATANGVTDSVIVRAVNTQTEISVASDFTSATATNHWLDTDGASKTVSNEGYTTLSIGQRKQAYFQYTTKDANNGSTGTGQKTGALVWEADIRISKVSQGIDFMHRTSDTTQETAFFKIYGRPGTVWAPDPQNAKYPKRFEVGEWLNIKFVFDMDASTYTVYLNDEAISYDNALPGTMADGVDGIIMKMYTYSDGYEGSFDIKNFSLRTFEQGLTIDSPQSGTLQEANRKMPVVLSAKGIGSGDTIVVKGSDGATAEATVRADGKYVAYLVPTVESDAYTVTASVVSGGTESHTQSVTVKTAKTFQLGAWDFDTDANTGITESSDNFYSAWKGNTTTHGAVAGVGGKDNSDFAYQMTDNASSSNAAALSFWPMNSEKYSVLIGEFDMYYQHGGGAIGISFNGNSKPIGYLGKDHKIQYTKGSWPRVTDELSDKTWYHFKAMFDVTNQTFDLYLDDDQIFHQVGSYDADTNPWGLPYEMTSIDTFWIGFLESKTTGVLTLDNISIRTLDNTTERTKAKKVVENTEIIPIGVLKSGASFTVSAAESGLHYGNTLTLYQDGTKVGDMTKVSHISDGTAYYQANITAPTTGSETVLKVEDTYGAVAEVTVPIQNPTATFDFASAPNGTTYANNHWAMYLTNMAYDTTNKKLKANGTNAGSWQIQAPDTYTNGVVVIDFKADVPTQGSGNLTLRTREKTTNAVAPTLGYISQNNAGYNPTAGGWVYNNAVPSGEQNFRYVMNCAEHRTSLYIGGDLVMSYVNSNATAFSSLTGTASAASLANTLDDVEVYYIAPQTSGTEGVTYGISNTKFTTVHGLDITTAELSGLRSVDFSADYTPQTNDAVKVILALYANHNGAKSLTSAQVLTPSVAADTTTHLSGTITCAEGIASGSEIKVFLWKADNTMDALADVIIPYDKERYQSKTSKQEVLL